MYVKTSKPKSFQSCEIVLQSLEEVKAIYAIFSHKVICRALPELSYASVRDGLSKIYDPIHHGDQFSRLHEAISKYSDD